MEKIINNLITSSHFFDVNLKDIKPDLLMYLYNNIKNENYNIFRLDLKNVLTINANGKYV
jgi:hypothetical protein